MSFQNADSGSGLCRLYGASDGLQALETYGSWIPNDWREAMMFRTRSRSGVYWAISYILAETRESNLKSTTTSLWLIPLITIFQHLVVRLSFLHWSYICLFLQH